MLPKSLKDKIGLDSLRDKIESQAKPKELEKKDKPGSRAGQKNQKKNK